MLFDGHDYNKKLKQKNKTKQSQLETTHPLFKGANVPISQKLQGVAHHRFKLATIFCEACMVGKAWEMTVISSLKLKIKRQPESHMYYIFYVKIW